MANDMKIWRKLVDDEVDSVADEAFQRKVWFGGGEGRWVDSPTEQFCRFFDNAQVPEFAVHPENGLDAEQATQLVRLSDMMEHLSNNTPDSIRPDDLIDDPRWDAIRKQAAITAAALKG